MNGSFGATYPSGRAVKTPGRNGGIFPARRVTDARSWATFLSIQSVASDMASRTKVFAAALLLVACCSAFSSNDNLQLVQPTGNGLKLERVKTKDGAEARFTGQTWLTGRFVARWFGGANSTSDKAPEYVLIPDANGVGNLPHFTLLYKHQRLRYLVKAVDLTNGEAALRSIVGEKQARQLLDRRIGAVDVSGSFLLMDYEVGVECDAAWAHATFVKARIPSHLLASRGEVPEGC